MQTPKHLLLDYNLYKEKKGNIKAIRLFIFLKKVILYKKSYFILYYIFRQDKNSY